MTTTTQAATAAVPTSALPSAVAFHNALAAFVAQRSGIDWRNYGGSREAFMGDYRPMLQAGADARVMLRAAGWRDFSSAEYIAAAGNGRLQFITTGEFVGVDYCAGQYFPTEYRRAACSLLATMFWSRFRDGAADGSAIRRRAAKEFGRGIARRWFGGAA